MHQLAGPGTREADETGIDPFGEKMASKINKARKRTQWVIEATSGFYTHTVGYACTQWGTQANSGTHTHNRVCRRTVGYGGKQ